jgi:hypothetical protein
VRATVSPAVTVHYADYRRFNRKFRRIS